MPRPGRAPRGPPDLHRSILLAQQRQVKADRLWQALCGVEVVGACWLAAPRRPRAQLRSALARTGGLGGSCAAPRQMGSC